MDDRALQALSRRGGGRVLSRVCSWKGGGGASRTLGNTFMRDNRCLIAHVSLREAVAHF